MVPMCHWRPILLILALVEEEEACSEVLSNVLTPRATRYIKVVGLEEGIPASEKLLDCKTWSAIFRQSIYWFRGGDIVSTIALAGAGYTHKTFNLCCVNSVRQPNEHCFDTYVGGAEQFWFANIKITEPGSNICSSLFPGQRKRNGGDWAILAEEKFRL